MTWKRFAYHLPFVRGSIGHRWFSTLSDCNAMPWCLLSCWPEQMVEQTAICRWFDKTWRTLICLCLHDICRYCGAKINQAVSNHHVDFTVIMMSQASYWSVHLIVIVRQALTHWQNGQYFTDELSSAFLWMKVFEFRLEFDWNMFFEVELTVIQHWFR